MGWEQGQHVCIVGSNGSGKTFLESRLLPQRAYGIFFRTKSDDIKFPAFRRITHARDALLEYNYQTGRAKSQWFLLEPKYEQQRPEGYRLVQKAWTERGWTIAFDELWYAQNELGLERGINRLLTQGRSLKISVVVGMQRPSRVSRFALSECVHLFAFRCEGRDIVTLGEAFTPRLRDVLPKLQRYQFAYFNRITSEIRIGTAQTLRSVFA